MRKSFFSAVTFLIGLAPLSCLSDVPELRVYGQSSFVCYFYDQALYTSRKTSGHHMDVSSSRIYLDITGSSTSLGGLDYSLLFGISGDANLDKNLVENRILIHKNKIGSVLLGNTKGIDSFMRVGSDSVLGGIGGYNGPYHKVLNRSNGVLTSRDLVGHSRNATRAIYLTPRVAGLQVGVSLTPNTEHIGEAMPSPNLSINQPAQPYDRDQLGIGVNYKQALKNDFEVSLSGTLLLAKTIRCVSDNKNQKKSELTPRFDTKSYALGTLLGWKRWKIVGELIDNGRSHIRTKMKGQDAGKVLNLAASYSRGNGHLALGWYGSSRKIQASSSYSYPYSGDEYLRAAADVWSVTLDYKLSRIPCVLVYAEANLFDYVTDDKSKRFTMLTNNRLETTGNMSNLGHVYLIGSRVIF